MKLRSGTSVGRIEQSKKDEKSGRAVTSKNVGNSDLADATTIVDLPNEFTELLKCYQCDCTTAPFCTIAGELCHECFDYTHFVHKKPREKFPGTFSPYTECPHTGAGNTTTEGARFYVVRSPSDGDCLYHCVCNALNALNTLTVSAALNASTGSKITTTSKFTVEMLRRLVSRRQTEHTYNMYMTLADTTDEYANLREIQSFSQFRQFIRQCGSTVGAEECLWGDENALQIFSNEYGLTFVVFNEKGNVIQKVLPDLLNESNDAPTEIHCPRYVLLRLNEGKKGQEHFDLLQFNGASILNQNLWEYLQKKTSS